MKAVALFLLLVLPPLKAAAAELRELKEFPKDMWGSLREEGRREGLLTLITAGAGAGIARYGSRTYFDDFNLARTLDANRPLGVRATDAGAAIGNAMYLLPAMAGTYVAGRYFESGGTREFGALGFESLVLAGVQTQILKLSVSRLRPDTTDRAAFPSGHTASSFALATAAASTWGWKAGAPAYLLASFVGYTRMEKGSHYLSDVVFGAGLGVMSGRAVYKYRRRAHPARYAVAPYFSPGGGGLMVAF